MHLPFEEERAQELTEKKTGSWKEDIGPRGSGKCIGSERGESGSFSGPCMLRATAFLAGNDLNCFPSS